MHVLSDANTLRAFHYALLFTRVSGEQLTAIAELVDAGALRPVVGATFPFDQTPAALASLHTSGAPGKTVVLGA